MTLNDWRYYPYEFDTTPGTRVMIRRPGRAPYAAEVVEVMLPRSWFQDVRTRLTPETIDAWGEKARSLDVARGPSFDCFEIPLTLPHRLRMLRDMLAWNLLPVMANGDGKGMPHWWAQHVAEEIADIVSLADDGSVRPMLYGCVYSAMRAALELTARALGREPT